MTDDQWFREAVVYQIYPRSFQDSDGDGIGDVPGIIRRLDYLQQLGVDVLWLSPIYTSPQDDNGYDIADYQDIDPTFGTLADVDELVEQAHARGIRIVMDLVVNHTSDEHPWFVESRSSKDNPKRDWYWWRPARDGYTAGEVGAEPTNWESFFSGPAWELDEKTGDYYLHLFSRKQPDLNWENPEVREAVYEMMRWWLDRGVDGFRMDVINMISKVTSLPDGEPLPATPQLGDGTPHFLNGPRIHEFLQEMHRAVFEGRPEKLLTVGEMPGVTVEDAILYTDPERHEVDMVFQFEHVGLDIGAHKWDRSRVDLRDLKASLGRWQEALAEVGWNSLYWNNHDQPRAVSRFGSDAPEHRVASAKLLGTVLHLHRGTPYVYQGEELGMTNVPFATADDFLDIESVNYYRLASGAGGNVEEILANLRLGSRDNARSPMQWDDSANAGFTTGQPWAPANPNYPEINAAAAVADDDSVFHHYRRLIELRHTEPAVAHGDFRLLAPDHRALYAFTRSHDGTDLLVLANFGTDELDLTGPELADAIDVTGWDSSTLLLGNLDDPASPTAPLRAWEARILRR
ncbi:oligo-1,6-glucosidase [Pedococcus dokdonensis]|uniref:Oligo-1,6-glucosidase n=1 Tax=Pedococcus dokdonensis TaxID=443156 RepID=A0A1H0SIM5_9MICO|nr:alpha-glucosidase [Pedococcus dokdonensis]SDP41641.1 oligo-1,6-glucosidase [Pedococcus dokdonensis]